MFVDESSKNTTIRILLLMVTLAIAAEKSLVVSMAEIQFNFCESKSAVAYVVTVLQRVIYE